MNLCLLEYEPDSRFYIQAVVDNAVRIIPSRLQTLFLIRIVCPDAVQEHGAEVYGIRGVQGNVHADAEFKP